MGVSQKATSSMGSFFLKRKNFCETIKMSPKRLRSNVLEALN